MSSVTCKTCKWWEPWKLPEGKTLFDITKQMGVKGDCRNEHPNNNKTTTFSSNTCDFAEKRED